MNFVSVKIKWASFIIQAVCEFHSVWVTAIDSKCQILESEYYYFVRFRINGSHPVFHDLKKNYWTVRN